MKSVQRTETQVAVFVGERAGVARFLSDLLDLRTVPSGVACQQNPSCVGVHQNPDASRCVAGEVDEGDSAVPEQVVTALEGRDRRTVEGVCADRPVLQRIANATDRRDGSNAGGSATRNRRLARPAIRPVRVSSAGRRVEDGRRHGAPPAPVPRPAAQRRYRRRDRPTPVPADVRSGMRTMRLGSAVGVAGLRRSLPSAPAWAPAAGRG